MLIEVLELLGNMNKDIWDFLNAEVGLKNFKIRLDLAEFSVPKDVFTNIIDLQIEKRGDFHPKLD